MTIQVVRVKECNDQQIQCPATASVGMALKTELLGEHGGVSHPKVIGCLVRQAKLGFRQLARIRGPERSVELEQLREEPAMSNWDSLLKPWQDEPLCPPDDRQVIDELLREYHKLGFSAQRTVDGT